MAAQRSLEPSVQVRILGGQLSLLLALALPLGATAQQETGRAGVVADGEAERRLQLGSDSARIVDELEDAQARFERRRARWSPTSPFAGWGGSCDETVGRMCLRHHETGDWWPEPEDPRLVAARSELLDLLRQGAEMLPGHDWIVGQLVFYLGESGRWEEAGRLTGARCRATPWWCSALHGLSLHARHRVGPAKAAFRAALASMPEEIRREWKDPSVLLDGDGLDLLEEAREDGREGQVLETLWLLSDPLFLVPGNDRRNEHYARRTVARIRGGGRNPYGMSWGDDLEELLVRYGWEIGWERTPPGSGTLEVRGGVVGHHAPQSRSYVPPGRFLEDADFESGSWSPAVVAPRTGYAPPYAPVILPMEGRIRIVPLGDSVAVLARYALPEDTTWHRSHDHPAFEPPRAFAGRSVEAGLVLASLDSAGRRVERRTRRAGQGTLWVMAPAGRWVVGLEVWAPEQGLAGRLRRGITAEALPPDVLALSELLLLDHVPADSTPDLSEVAEGLAADSVLGTGEDLVVAWVVHGLGWREERLSYRLEVEEDGGGFFSKAGRFLGLADDPRRQSLAWEEEAPPSPGPHVRVVRMTLPELDPGDFTVRLELGTVGRPTLVAEREIRIEESARR